MSDNTSNNKRIAKNTLLLYVRMLFLMLISLYTSRVVLNALGVEDYGIYNVVGGVVAMFSVLSGSFSSSISRFITFELGKGDMTKLKTIFSTSVNIQLGLVAFILLIGEAVGIWFINNQLNIPSDRIIAASWVFQCSLLTFCINLISVPYNSCIIAHECMSAFAYISILEGVLKLLICYLLIVSPIDKLVAYSILMLLVALVIRLVYGNYCSRHFEESRYQFCFDKDTLRSMTGFAGWSFFSNVAWICNTQGVNILVNIFFNVALNAARGIASQVEGAVMLFVRNFMTALNPQITKYYASNELSQMYNLMCRGTKFTYFLTWIMLLPLMLETEFVLTLWLKEVPEHTVVFVRLTLIGSVINNVGNTCYTACQATGNIKRYSIIVTSIGFLVFPITWAAFKMGMPSESMYIIYIIVYLFVSLSCILMTHRMVGLPLTLFLRKAITPMAITTLVSIIIPATIYIQMQSSWGRFFTSCISSVLCTSLAICIFGLTESERNTIKNKILQVINK